MLNGKENIDEKTLKKAEIMKAYISSELIREV